jgi:tetratricopeptide (TPR) repeat protein
MPLFLMLLLLGVGISIYIRQRFNLGNRMVSGQRARTVGCLLMLPLPLSIMVMTCWLTGFVGQYASIEAMQQAIMTDPSIREATATIELMVLLGCIGLAAWLMFSGAGADGGTEAVGGAGTLQSQSITLRQASGYSRLTENQLMILIRANAILAQRMVDGYRLDAKLLELWMYMERGVTEYNRREYGQAIQDFSRALMINPKAAEAYTWRGFAYLRAGRMSEGLQDIRYALSHTQDTQERAKLAGWLSAPNKIPLQITGRNPATERVVTDWLAGVDTVDPAGEPEPVRVEPFVDVAATPYLPIGSDDNETMRT